MAFIRVVNDSGVTLIDSEVFNLYLSQKGQLTMNWDVNIGDCMVITYNAKSNLPPLLAISCSSHHASLLSVKKDGNTYTYTIIYVDSSTVNSAVAGNYYIFDAGELTKVGVGELIIRNKDGYVTFDSHNKYLRIHSVENYPRLEWNEWFISGPVDGDLVKELPIGRRFAAVTNKVGYIYAERVNGGEVMSNWYYDGVRIASIGGNVSRHMELYQQSLYESSGANFTQNSSDSQHMIVDVTGY
ncbi:hypothetical protein Dpoa2040_003633 [Dickeya sp. CFBP 2040]|uniref:hypothetical protein n=1 Tax=Dickeya sp. CFBP 2040 TaxID=2718531 RepID=UPI001445C38D|nr:hypothetical protein [Dickeya sp. CFBP 2040]NKI76290.1 hypothetical protein [Dickeya sp. CFBP 2040]